MTAAVRGPRREVSPAVCQEVGPEIGVLMRYRDRVVRVLAEARGQRAMIESVDDEGRTYVSTVKWGNLAGLSKQLF
jgi:hypothetical protein